MADENPTMPLRSVSATMPAAPAVSGKRQALKNLTNVEAPNVGKAKVSRVVEVDTASRLLRRVGCASSAVALFLAREQYFSGNHARGSARAPRQRGVPLRSRVF
jgi:hypothetical protein